MARVIFNRIFRQAKVDPSQGKVKVTFTLLNWIHNSRLSKNPAFPPFEKGGNRKYPFVKGDLEGFSSAQHDFDETLIRCAPGGGFWLPPTPCQPDLVS
jgi:hypothetical protein